MPPPLATLVSEDLLAKGAGAAPASVGGLPGLPHFAPRAKRVIYLFQGGAPSQHDLWEYKPGLANMRGTDLPDSVRQGAAPDADDGDAGGLPRSFRPSSSSTSTASPGRGSAS